MMRLSKRAKRRIVIVGLVMLVLVILAGFVVLNRGAAQDARIAEAREEGLAAYAQGDYETALGKLSTYLGQHRDDLEALVAFADSRAKVPVENNRHTVEAMGLYRAALEVDPNHFDAMAGLLVLYERVGHWIEMKELADRILDQDPDHIEALRLRAIGAYRDSQFEHAGRNVNRLMELEPGKIEWRAMYLQLLRAQDRPLEELLAVCEEWDEQFEGDGRYRLMMAQLLVEAGQRSEAENAAGQAARRGAHEPQVLQQMVGLLDALRMRDAASELIKAMIEKFPEELWPHETYVRRHWQNNRLHDALDVIDDVLATRGELNQDLLQWQAFLLIMLGHDEDAGKTVVQLEERLAESEASERDARQGWILAMRARLNAADASWRETRNAYQMAVSLAPRDPVLHFLLGEAFMGVNEYDLAIRSLETAQQSDPNWLAAQIAYAEALLLAGQVEDALELAHGLLQRIESPGLTAYTLFARCWLDAGRPRTGIGLVNRETGGEADLLDLLQFIYDSHPDQTTVRELLARAAARYGERQIVVDVIEDAVREESPAEELLIALARISHRNEIGLTDTILDRAREVHGLTLQIAETAAYIHNERGNPEEGLALLRQAVDDPRSGDDLNRERVLAGYLARIEHPDAPEAMRKLLDRDDPEVGSFILSFPMIWNHADLTKQAIQRFAEYVGDDSPRVVLARANYVLRHEPENAAGLADAQIAVNDVLQRMPGSLAALNLMTQLALHGDQPNVERAIRYMQQAVRHHPNRVDVYFRLIPLLQQQGDFAAAEQYLNRLRGIRSDDPNFRRAELDLWHAQGDFDQVIARLSESIDSASPESDRLTYLAHLHRAGRFEEADQHLQDILSNPDRSDTAVLVAAQIYADRGRLEEAIDIVERSTLEGGEVAKAILRGRVFQHVDRLVEARQHYHDALDIDDQNIEAITYLVGVELGLGESRRAFDHARQGLQLDPDNNALRSSFVLAAMALGAAEQADAMQLVDEIETESSALAQTLRLYRRLSRPEGGLAVRQSDLADLRQLTYDFPRFMPAWRLAILAHMEAGERGEAIRLARQAAARLPHLADPAEMAAQLLVQDGRLPEALDMARMWRERSQHRPLRADVLIASIRLDQGQPDRAHQQLQSHGRNLVEDADREPMHAALWLQSLMRSGHIRAAYEQFRPLLHESSDWRELWLEVNSALELNDARQALKIAESEFHNDAASRLNLAVAWASLGQRFDQDELLAHAEQEAIAAADESDNLSQGSLLLRGQIAEAREEYEKSIALYREFLSVDPEHPVALNNLAYRLLDDERDCAEAAELAAKAVQLMPSIPEIMNTHALAQLCIGDPVQAEEYARKAISERQDGRSFHLTLGLALAKQERWDEAREAITEVERLIIDEASMTKTFQDRLTRLRDQLNRHAARGT